MTLRDDTLRELRRADEARSQEAERLRRIVDSFAAQGKSTAWTKQTLKDSAYNDLLVSPSSIKLPPAGAPAWTAWKTDLYALVFSQGDVGHFQSIQLPHSYIPGTDLYPHIHFAPTVAIADTETVVWEMKYTDASVWGVFPALTTLTMTFTNNASSRAKLAPAALSGTDIVADTHLIAGGATIVGTDLGLSALVTGSVEYTSASTHSDDVAFMSADAHIRLNRLGSQQEYTG